MPVTKCLDSAQCTDEVTLRGLLTNRQQRISRTAKRRYDDNRRLIEPPAHDFRRSLYRLGVTDRRSAEFDDDHAGSNRPVAASSSALRTDPPAAPRIVLWPI